MQYGVEIFPYQRIKKIKDKQKQRLIRFPIMKVTLVLLSALLASRVVMVNLMAPFGLAFLIAIIVYEDKKMSLAAGIGTLIGYLTVIHSMNDLPMYILASLMLIISKYILDNMKQKSKLLILFSGIFVEFIAYKLFIGKIVFGMSVLTSFFEICCIFPIYFIINYSMECFKLLRTRHLYTSEEIISMSIVMSLIVAGTWGVDIKGITIRNVVALTFVLILGYVKGSSAGSAVGVAMGTIIGMTSSNMIIYVGVYGLCGLVSGVFRETGKWMSGISYLVAFSVLKMYSNIAVQFNIIEVIISCCIFLAIPVSILNKIEVELEWEKKQEYFKESYAERIKGILMVKLESFSDILHNISEALEKLVNNDKLIMKNKSSAMIENLAGRVCSDCSMKSMCWNRENFYTYNAFGELIQNFQDNNKDIPYELERKCTKRSVLLKETENIVNNYIISEMWRNRLSECRELLGGQIDNMASSVSEIVKEFDMNIRFNPDIENRLRRILTKNKIKYVDMFCYNDKNERIIIKISMEACGGKQLCAKKILPLVNQAADKIMCINDDGCKINNSLKTCDITFEEMPKYYVSTYAGKMCKDGEEFSGDSYTFGKSSDGAYISMISDGMGSGPEAGQESSAVVNIVQKFLKQGFDKITAINTVNSIMSIKFSEDEKFSTIDLSSIDLYSGKIDFVKIGAAASFIKRGEDVSVIDSKSLPIGVLDKPDIDSAQKKVKNGDLIIMVSDGILDHENKSVGSVDWFIEFLKGNNCNDPKQLGHEIIDKSKEISNGKIRDDMTVIVGKVYSLY